MPGKQSKARVKRAKTITSKYFLYFTAFFSGMSVMAIELGASRLLAPYFSSSQIIWTIIIGTIMIALAIGNVTGGRLVDKNSDPLLLYIRLFIAACWTAAIPFAGKYVITAVSLGLASFIKTNFLIWASFISCMLVFVFPLILLGTVSPALVKMCAQRLDNNGRIVGELSALNTIGCILGTFLPTFVTIPAVGTAATFLIFSGILIIICLIYFISAGVYVIRGAVTLAIVIALLLFPVNNSFAFWESNLLYEGESIYNYLQVKDTPNSVIFSTNVMEGVQSIMMKNDELTGMYFEYALAGPLIAGIPLGKEVASVARDYELLTLGLGTGTFATQCLKYFPLVSFDGVEIDEKIVWLAAEFFRLPIDVRAIVDDGRMFLDKSGVYDVILVDAYQDITIPFQMSSYEFFGMVKEHLKENGLMVVNLNMRSEKEGSLNHYICDTIASQFPYVYTMPLHTSTNTILFASSYPDALDRLRVRLAELEELEDGAPLRSLMNDLLDRLKRYESSGLMLTDDKAPVEMLGMRVIDELIGSSLEYYQRVFKEHGLLGLLRSMGITG